MDGVGEVRVRVLREVWQILSNSTSEGSGNVGRGRGSAGSGCAGSGCAGNSVVGPSLAESLRLSLSLPRLVSLSSVCRLCLCRVRSVCGNKNQPTRTDRAAAGSVGFSSLSPRLSALQAPMRRRQAAQLRDRDADGADLGWQWAAFQLVDVRASVEEFFEQLRLPVRSPHDW